MAQNEDDWVLEETGKRSRAQEEGLCSEAEIPLLLSLKIQGEKQGQ